MDYFLTLLSKPIVVTAITLSVGSYLFTRLTEARSKREKIREKSLQLLEEVGTDINAVLSLVYRHIRTVDFEIQKESAVNEKRAALFVKRFSVRIRSKVFLKSDEFWEKYEDLTFEIDKIVKLMASLSNEYDLDKVLNGIKANKERFAKDWPCNEREYHSPYNQPSKELVIWADMVWDRANWLITSHLDKLFR